MFIFILTLRNRIDDHNKANKTKRWKRKQATKEKYLYDELVRKIKFKKQTKKKAKNSK